MSEQKKSKCTKRRRPASTTYWNVRHPANMLRRAIRVYSRVKAFTGDMNRAKSQAIQCAEAHGALVKARLEVWIKNNG